MTAFRRVLVVIALAGSMLGLSAGTASARGREICVGQRLFSYTYEVCIPVP